MLKDIIIIVLTYLYYYLNNKYYDIMEAYQINVQDPCTLLNFNITNFNMYIMGWLTMIFISICYISYESLINISPSKKVIDHSGIEFIWTLSPAIILVFIALPSLNLLYKINESIETILSLKVIGNQWFWYYEDGDWIRV